MPFRENGISLLSMKGSRGCANILTEYDTLRRVAVESVSRFAQEWWSRTWMAKTIEGNKVGTRQVVVD